MPKLTGKASRAIRSLSGIDARACSGMKSAVTTPASVALMPDCSVKSQRRMPRAAYF
jgi:hypothetical protein